MKQLFDWLPAFAFLGFFFFSAGSEHERTMAGTAAMLVVSVLQITLGWLIWRKVQRMHLGFFVLTLVLGGLTLLLDDDAFIKWRPTVVYALLSGILFVSHFTPGRNLVHRLGEGLMQSTFGRVIPVPAANWNRINAAFVLYWTLLALANLYVIHHFSTDFWVKFKYFGLSVTNLVFYFAIFTYLYRSMPEADRQALLHDQPTRREQKEHRDEERN